MTQSAARTRELGPEKRQDQPIESSLLTQEEAIRLLRLDALKLKRPKEALRYLRCTGQIAYVKVCGKVLFPKQAIQQYLRRNLFPIAGAVDPPALALDAEADECYQEGRRQRPGVTGKEVPECGTGSG